MITNTHHSVEFSRDGLRGDRDDDVIFEPNVLTDKSTLSSYPCELKRQNLSFALT